MGARAAVLAALALGLAVADAHFDLAGGLRSNLSALAKPFYWLADTPSRVAIWGEGLFQSEESLQEEVERLSREALILRGRVQQMSSLVAENGRLRELLNSSALLKRDDVLSAEIIGLSPEPGRHKIIIDKGDNDQVALGQPVIDADGLMGQVVEVSPVSARILLIADTLHAVPVQINRNGVRCVVEGTGRLDQMALRHVAPTTDIKVGDLLVTSGLGGRFPVGYPVAEVTSIVDDPGQPFLNVLVAPTARLSQSRHVLLVFSHREVAAMSAGD